MKFKSFRLDITDMEDAAMDEYPREEVARILRETADKVENGTDYGNLRDFNGNNVGHWDLVERD